MRGETYNERYCLREREKEAQKDKTEIDSMKTDTETYIDT